MSESMKIGPEFFRKVPLDYADWRWALVREFLQNCFDAPGCGEAAVTVHMTDDGKNTLLTVANDGDPMSESDLRDKLLTLGGSGKNFCGENTGGFGVAKSLLYYCHDGYAIQTGDLLVQGAGGSYDVRKADARLPGTSSTVSISDDHADEVRETVKRWAALSQWRGKLTLDGAVVAVDMRKGSRRRDLGWAVVYTNKSAANLCVVRLNGQAMFTRSTGYKGCVVVELVGKGKDTLTSNRDGLVYPYGSQLGDFLTSLAVDKRSAMKEQRAEYKRWAGEKARAEARAPRAAGDGLAGVLGSDELVAMAARVAAQSPVVQVPTGAGVHCAGGVQVVTLSREDAQPVAVSLGTDFILKNCTGKRLPTRYVPGEKFDPDARQLVRSWTSVLLKLYQLCGVGGVFSVGFVFDDESEAEHETSTEYGRVYYVNPVKGGEPRFHDTWSGRHQLISLAAHEFVHGAYGLAQHDEDYAAKLTDVLAVVIANLVDLSELCHVGDPRDDADQGDAAEQYLSAIFALEAQERRIAELEAKLTAK